MKAKLVVLKGAKTATVEIKRFPVTIGRSKDASLKLATAAVSKNHCEIYEEDGDLFVRDLGSTKGTYVNKQKINGPTVIATGDLLTVGPVTFNTVCADESPPDDSYVDLDAEGDEANESRPMSQVGYQETSDGSFINIDQEAAPPAKAADIKDDSAITEKRSTTEASVEDGTEEALVESDDAALNDFLKSFE
jgi:predicted component of type VI protein secretion system